MSLPRIIILATRLTARLYILRWRAAKQHRENRRCRTVRDAYRAAIDARTVAYMAAWDEERRGA